MTKPFNRYVRYLPGRISSQCRFFLSFSSCHIPTPPTRNQEIFFRCAFGDNVGARAAATVIDQSFRLDPGELCGDLRRLQLQVRVCVHVLTLREGGGGELASRSARWRPTRPQLPLARGDKCSKAHPQSLFLRLQPRRKPVTRGCIACLWWVECRAEVAQLLSTKIPSSIRFYRFYREVVTVDGAGGGGDRDMISAVPHSLVSLCPALPISWKTFACRAGIQGRLYDALARFCCKPFPSQVQTNSGGKGKTPMLVAVRESPNLFQVGQYRPIQDSWGQHQEPVFIGSA